jgi:hypothetical protein
MKKLEPVCSLPGKPHAKATKIVFEVPKTIFAIVCNQTIQDPYSHKLFFSKEKARECLRKMGEERRYNLGVDHFKMDDDSFSFILGWEEAMVRFRIIELPIEG